MLKAPEQVLPAQYPHAAKVIGCFSTEKEGIPQKIFPN